MAFILRASAATVAVSVGVFWLGLALVYGGAPLLLSACKRVIGFAAAAPKRN
jgi:hypothetical protein